MPPTGSRDRINQLIRDRPARRQDRLDSVPRLRCHLQWRLEMRLYIELAHADSESLLLELPQYTDQLIGHTQRKISQQPGT